MLSVEGREREEMTLEKLMSLYSSNNEALSDSMIFAEKQTD